MQIFLTGEIYDIGSTTTVFKRSIDHDVESVYISFCSQNSFMRLMSPSFTDEETEALSAAGHFLSSPLSHITVILHSAL